MVSIEVVIKGITPLLQHRFSESTEGTLGKATRSVLVQRGTPREEAEKACYRDKQGNLYHPGAAILRLLREAGGGHKLKGSRKSAKFIVPAAVTVMEDAIPLHKSPTDGRLTDFEVDSRPVTIPATKGRVMHHRPRQDEWAAKFTLRLNDKILPIDFVQELLVEGGQQIGIGDYRPEKGGPFGTFAVVSWKPIEK